MNVSERSIYFICYVILVRGKNHRVIFDEFRERKIEFWTHLEVIRRGETSHMKKHIFIRIFISYKNPCINFDDFESNDVYKVQKSKVWTDFLKKWTSPF